MKKFLNAPEEIMDQMLDGMAMANQHILRREPGTHRMLRREPKASGKVKLIIGNGGGHEPGSIGWVGYGMYDMASMGDVFAAQSGRQLFESMEAINDGSPILLTIANHAGDVMNGRQAVQLAKRAGLNVASAIFYDDIASAPKEFPEERRGLTGMFFGVKMAGAAAEAGCSLEECIRAFETARTNTRSISVSMTGCTHPQTGLQMMEIPDDVVSIGAGVHGEGGAAVIPMAPCRTIVDKAMQLLWDDMPLETGTEVLLLINGMGATTQMELAIFYQDALHWLQERGVRVYDGIADSLFTTQETAGITVSLCVLDEERKIWWDAPCRTVGYTNR